MYRSVVRTALFIILRAAGHAGASAENDALTWPHCDGLNWPHLRPIVA